MQNKKMKYLQRVAKSGIIDRSTIVCVHCNRLWRGFTRSQVSVL